jgi:hypothetical protein
MQRLWLTGQILPAGARLVVQHVFQSEEDKSLEVIYAFPLPRDATLRRFRVTGEGFEAHSELREKHPRKCATNGQGERMHHPEVSTAAERQ